MVLGHTINTELLVQSLGGLVVPNGYRLGIVGLILACVGIAITILWPTVRSIGWVAIAVAIGLGALWTVLEFKRQKLYPSFVFVFGAPLGDNSSPVWVMLLKHFGPNPAYNCDIEFFDEDRKSIEHQWLVRHPNSPYPAPELAGKSQERFHIPEAGAQGSGGSFQWTPVDPDRQHYTASIICREGTFVEHWEVTRIDGALRTKIRIEHGPQWIEKNPKLNPVIFECVDPEFTSSPLALVLPEMQRQPTHPGWKPNHRFEFPVAIIDPNSHVQVMSGVKLPDGSVKTDFGCWNILLRHYGDKPPSRIFRFLRRWFVFTQKQASNSRHL